MIEDSYSWLLRNFALPCGDVVFGQRMISRLRYLEKAQWWDRERVHAERNRSLRNVIQLAYREVPFYRNLMDQSGVTPDQIRTPNDLVRLPIATKDMLRAAHPHLTTRPTGQRTYQAYTSGSTGKNFAVTEDSATKGWYLASVLLSLEWSGWKIGEPHMQTGMNLDRSLSRRLKDAMLRCHYTSAFDLDDRHVDAHLDLLDTRRINHLFGYAASMYYFALRARQRGWNRPLYSVVTWGDNLYPKFRREIEGVFGVRVTDTYGIGEGTQIAAQCSHGNYHVHTLDTIVEYVDDEGHAVPAGTPGNLILTRLHAGPMPLIRYRVGDMGVAGDQSQCPCGRGFDRMHSLMGRDSDVVLTPSGNRLIVHFFTGIIEYFQEIDSFQVVQETLDSMVINVVPAVGYSDETAGKMIAAMQRSGAGDIKIQVNCVDKIGLTPGGKRRYVISNLARPGVLKGSNREQFETW